jgi:DNA replication protein DnaC
LDRLLHHSAVISIQGNSYRLMGKQVKVVANEIRKMN